MMRITAEEITQLGQLARLALDEGETRDMVSQLDGILACMQALDDVPAGDEECREGRDGVLRADVCAASAPRQAMLDNAPEQDGQYILVARTVE